MSRYQKGKTNLDFTEARDSEWQRHQLGYMQACTLLQTDNHASTPLLSWFYRPDALPAAEPTASKHRRPHTNLEKKLGRSREDAKMRPGTLTKVPTTGGERLRCLGVTVLRQGKCPVADIISASTSDASVARSLTRRRRRPGRGTSPTAPRPDRSRSTPTRAGSTPYGRAADAAAAEAGPRRRRRPRPRTGSGRVAPSISRSVERRSRAATPTSTPSRRRPSAPTSVARRPRRWRRAVSPRTRTSRTRAQPPPPPAADVVVVAVAIGTRETGSSRSSRPCLKLNTAAASVRETTIRYDTRCCFWLSSAR